MDDDDESLSLPDDAEDGSSLMSRLVRELAAVPPLASFKMPSPAIPLPSPAMPLPSLPPPPRSLRSLLRLRLPRSLLRLRLRLPRSLLPLRRRSPRSRLLLLLRRL